MISTNTIFSCNSLMHDLEHDVLVLIVEKVAPSDLANLRMVSKSLHSAVRDAGIMLRPNPGLLQEQHLLQLCTAFPQATNLNLSNCQNLTPSSLAAVQALSQTLKQLWLEGCTWVDASAITHLGALPNLELLALNDCPSLEALPESLSRLRSLACLVVRDCPQLAALPDSIRSLSALEHLEILRCTALSEFPEGFRELLALSSLDLMGCAGLRELPECMSGLSALQTLNLILCSSLTALPAWIGNLSSSKGST